MIALLFALSLHWNADLTSLANELPKMHPNAFHSTTREAFLGELERLQARSAAMQPHEVVVELARIVATIGDGHTRLTLPLDARYGFFSGHSKTDPPKHPELELHALPVRFVVYSDGLFTTDGRRVVRIGRLSADDAIRAVLPAVHGDNEWQKKQIVAQYLAVPEVLHARGVTESVSEVPIEFENETVVLKPVPPAEVNDDTALKPFAFEHLADRKAVVFTYNEVANTKEETLAAFAARMFRFIDEHEVNKLIIDLRENYGGNNSLNRAVVHGLIRARKLQDPGSVFVLVGRRTFSASMMLLVDLEKRTNAILIGEPTGGAPNGYGDSRKLILPNSGLTVRISTLYWQYSDPRDKRTTMAPHILAEPRRDRDLAMETALDYFGGTPSSTITGSWNGIITTEHERIPFTIVGGRIDAKFAPSSFTLRAGTKRLAGVWRSGGLEFLVTGESAPPTR